jgi:uncharacterized protein YbaR (Trm112 family)
LDEKAFYKESEVTKPAKLNCSYCRTVEEYQLRWLQRKKIAALPRHADERDRAKFAKAQSYLVLLDDKIACKKCRRTFEISGIKTTAFLTD